ACRRRSTGAPQPSPFPDVFLLSLAQSVAQLCRIVAAVLRRARPTTHVHHQRTRIDGDTNRGSWYLVTDGGSRIARDRRPDRLCGHGWLAAFLPNGSGGKAMT